MMLTYANGEEVCAGDIVIWLQQNSAFYQFDQPIMKVWNVAKTNDGEVVGVNLVPVDVEAPMMMLRGLIREHDPAPNAEVMQMKDVPNLYSITRWFIHPHQIQRCLGLIERIEFFIEQPSNHAQLIEQSIQQKAQQFRGIYSYYLAEMAQQARDFQRYIDLMRESAKSGYSPAMCQLGQELFIGRFLQKSLEGSFNWYREAAVKKDCIGLYELAGCYARAHGTAQDLDQSLKLLQQSVEEGCWGAALGLAAYYRFGWLNCFLVHSSYLNYGVVKDSAIHPKLAFQLYHHIITQAPETEKMVLANAYYQIAWMYQGGIGIAQDYEQCAQMYQKASDLGNIVATNNLADKYEHGLGVPQDLDMAVALYEQAAGQVVAADLSLGRMYVEGRGVAQDFEKAKAHLDVVLNARAEGIVEMQREAMSLLASCQLDSPFQTIERILADQRKYSDEQIREQISVVRNYFPLEQAESLHFKLYKLLAGRGDASAQYQLGYWYLKGFYTDINYEEAAYWIEKAAYKKDMYAETQIGYMYEKGLHYRKDLQVAEKWYNRALREVPESICPQFVEGSLNPQYLKMYESMNREALEGLGRIEAMKPKPSKWKFWKK